MGGLSKALQLPADLWDDETLSSLTTEAQLIHIRLMAINKLSPAGTVAYTPGRWAYILGWHADVFDFSFGELITTGYAYVDENEDCILTQHMAYQRIGGQPRRVAGAWDALAALPGRGRVQALGRQILQAEIDRAAGQVRPIAPHRARVFERDGWRCVTCGWTYGDPVPTAPTGRPICRELQVDHIYPRALGGTDDPENLQALCSSCNSRKGARI